MTLSAGDRLGRYEILGPLGAGGMGEVYRAKDTELDREVAIKVLLEAVAQDPDRIARFEREARLLASLSHQNIATLHGLEKHEGQRYLVMELAEGETLAKRLEKGSLPADEALEIAFQIANGLEAAHEAGIVHRDLKPANVMLAPEGRFPQLKDRVFTMKVPVGPDGASFRDPVTGGMIRERVVSLLGLTESAQEQQGPASASQ